jgi:hypothetical protein
MKTSTTKNRNKTPMQCLFGLAVLVLFVPRLSYKFYVCANNPAWVCRSRCTKDTRRPRPGARIIAPTYQHCRPLSIDKRYDLKLLIGLGPVEALTPESVSPAAVLTDHLSPSVSRIRRVAHPLRGPPPAISGISIVI